ncbi:MAG TPA: UDP-3-O-(3-hydroxymyristoyl)glucosamine N-acyltransferase [Spongiibacteraceae bacterium]|jgi:UDP-3-O-[3-hydroxymyristoyl] glucosamine N-acyltransferase|nr:UDP-3-O-(3-hydroxymyristoyl)glucosamine N-acyltransferase [Spongiibacteraceae bacterium]HUH37570.1 UDP-3-O-(3-hydroxymyristoyl)glucosamine N-acyltransferase [Spongiibacteraceae bacterium]
MPVHYTLGQLAELLGVECRGDAATVITGLATLAAAQPGQLSFLANRQYLADLRVTRASAVIVAAEFAGDAPCACLVSAQPYLSFARASALFDTAPAEVAGIHPSAVVDPGAELAADVSIGPGAVIGAGAVIGEGVCIGAHTVVGPDCRVGAGSRLHARVTLYHRVRIGAQCVIHSGAVLGADGFGFAPGPQGWEKVHQLGGVWIGDGVEIGANTTIDRGALDDTVIGDGVIIDNLVQIAHNVRIGDGSAIAGCVGIAGSAVIGKRCTIAGGAGIVGHVEIADGVHVTGMTMITGSIAERGSWSSGTTMDTTRNWRRNAVRFAQLDKMARRLARLEARLDGLNRDKDNDNSEAHKV